MERKIYRRSVTNIHGPAESVYAVYEFCIETEVKWESETLRKSIATLLTNCERSWQAVKFKDWQRNSKIT